MTDAEYKECLDALAKTYIQPLRIDDFKLHHGLRYEMARLSSTAIFAKAVAERSDDQELLKKLSEELDNRHVAHVVDRMRDSGVLAALDALPDITFAELRRSAIPDEDIQFMREAGVTDPEAEITVIIHFARKRLANRQITPSELAAQAQDELKRVGERLNNLSASSSDGRNVEVKKKKIFNGIGKILAGTVTGAGNLLLATGTILAPNPATAYGVIASSALAVGSICQGIGDLRGE